ncbi:hypothetical protein GF314_01455 [bacterium]|nr:hypothetical protein [bacterium]
MAGISWYVALASVIWAIVLLTIQLLMAWGGGRPDHSAPTGRRSRGILYNFTAAMLPSHKESARHHPAEFLIGSVLHVGVLLGVLGFGITLVSPQQAPILPVVTGVILGISLLAGAVLLVRRLVSPNLKAMSSPDDFIAIVVTGGFLALSILFAFERVAVATYFAWSSVLFFYLPLGKLRHCIFFFAARSDLGGRLGYRGTFPAQPKQGSTR